MKIAVVRWWYVRRVVVASWGDEMRRRVGLLRGGSVSGRRVCSAAV